VRRLLLTFVAYAVFSALAAVAHAEIGEGEGPEQQISAEQQLNDDLARWTRVLDRVGDQLQGTDLTPAILGKLRTTVADVQKRLTEARIPVGAEVERSKNVLDALGSAPKDGEPPESGEIISQRVTLNEDLADDTGRLKRLDVLIQQSREYLALISKAENTALGEQLFARTPSVLSWQTWSQAANDFGELRERARLGIDRWHKSEQVTSAKQSRFIFGALFGVLGVAALAFLLRRWLFREFGRQRDIELPSYRRRVLASLVETVARTAIPALVAGAIYMALYASGVLIDFMKELALGAVAAVIAFSITYGLPRAILSPSLPQWRLAAIGDGAARLWYRYALTLAVIVGLGILLAIPGAELRPTDALLAVYGLLMNTAYALVFFAMATDKRLWLTPDQEANAIASAVEPPTTPTVQPASRSRWWLVGRIVLATVAMAIPVTLLAGYSVLSDFIAGRLLATAGVFLIALVLHGLARDLIGVFALDRNKPSDEPDKTNPVYVWSVLFLDIGVVLTMAFLVVPLWGGHWDSILDRLGWTLTGFKIGERTFSITDVFAGMVTFIVLLALLRSVQHFINRRVLQQTSMDAGVRNSLSTGIGYVGLVIALLIAINMTGIDLSGLAIIAGALSVGVGFGLQSIVSNFVSGLVLLAERPIKVGDWIEVGAHQGIVQSISVRSTEIKTFERASVIVPNSELIANSVVNRMHKDKQGRLEVPVGVAYGSDVNKVREILLDCADKQSEILQNPAPFVLFMDFADSSLLFQLRAFVPDVGRRLRISSELRFAIDEAFREAGIEIPFPQRDIHIKETKVAVEVPAIRARTSRSSTSGRTRKSPARKQK